MKRLNSFCGVVSLQVGVAIISAIFLTFAVLITFINGFDYQKQEGFPLAVILVILFIIALAIVALLAFAGAYWEARPTMITALIIFIIVVVFWVVLSVLSFINSPKVLRNICVGERCPETMWMIPLKYRNNTLNETNGNGENGDTSTEPGRYMLLAKQIDLNDMMGKEKSLANLIETTPFDENRLHSRLFNGFLNDSFVYNKTLFSELKHNYTAANGQQLPSNSSALLGIDKDKIENTWNKFWDDLRGLILFQDTKDTKDEKEKDKDKDDEEVWETAIIPGWALFGGIFMFISTLLFFIFSAIIFWSFAKQLEEEYEDEEDVETIEYYDDRTPPPVVVIRNN